MSQERAQTPILMTFPRSPATLAMFGHQCDTSNQQEIDRVPELGFDESPQQNDYTPATPGNIPYPHEQYETVATQDTPCKALHSQSATTLIECQESQPYDRRLAFSYDLHYHRSQRLFGKALEGECLPNSGNSPRANTEHSNTGNYSSKLLDLEHVKCESPKDKDMESHNIATLTRSINNHPERTALNQEDRNKQQGYCKNGIEGEQNNVMDFRFSIHSTNSTSGTSLASELIDNSFEESEKRFYIPDNTQHIVVKTHEAKHVEVSDEQRRLLVEPTNFRPNLARILPYDLTQRLSDDPRRCVSSKVKEQETRCKHRSSWTLQDNKHLLKDNTWSQIYEDIMTAQPFVESMLKNAMCAQHSEIASGWLQALLTAVSQHSERSRPVGRVTHQFSIKDIDNMRGWLTAIQTAPTMRQDHAVPGHAATDEGELRITVTCPSSTAQPMLSEAAIGYGENLVPVLQETALKQKFISYCSTRHKHCLPTEDALRQALLKPLNKREQSKSGVVYVYWNPGDFGYLKIGVTSRDPETRFKEWKGRCGHDIVPHHLMTDEDADQSLLVQTPHIWRVEKLIHTELHRYRLIEPKCRGAKCKSHTEWFKVSVDLAKRVIDKWSQWMRQPQRYVQITESRSKVTKHEGNRESPKTETAGSLVTSMVLDRSFSDSDIDELCKPVEPQQVRSLTPTPRDRRRSVTPSSRDRRPYRARSTASSDLRIKLDFVGSLQFASKATFDDESLTTDGQLFTKEEQQKSFHLELS